MNFNKQHAIYERQMFNRLIKEFRAIGKKIPFDVITADNAENILSVVIKEQKIKEALIDTQLAIGNQYSAKVIKELDKAFKGQKKIGLPLFSDKFARMLIAYYTNQGGSEIVLLTDTYIQEVVKVIIEATKLNLRVDEISKLIFDKVNSPTFYKWQALRIARTETTFAMNSAKEITGEVSGYLMEKVWVTRVDGRERDSHRAVNSVAIPQNDSFIVGGEKMSFPGDKLHGASASQLVNCRCSFGYRGKRDANGSLIMVDL